MEMEKERGISITSTAMQFEYAGYQVRLRRPPVSTPKQLGLGFDKTLIPATKLRMGFKNASEINKKN